MSLKWTGWVEGAPMVALAVMGMEEARRVSWGTGPASIVGIRQRRASTVETGGISFSEGKLESWARVVS
jgi:hypothetical protein